MLLNRAYDLETMHDHVLYFIVFKYLIKIKDIELFSKKKIFIFIITTIITIMIIIIIISDVN